MVEKMEAIVAKQVEAISNLTIDKIVWDSGGNGGDVRAPRTSCRASSRTPRSTGLPAWPVWSCPTTWAASNTVARSERRLGPTNHRDGPLQGGALIAVMEG